VEVQVGRIVGEIVDEGDPQDVTQPWPEYRGRIGAVVEEARKAIVAQLHPARCSGDRRPKNAVLAADFRRLDQRLAMLRRRPAGS
jgi:ribosomal protein L21E